MAVTSISPAFTPSLLLRPLLRPMPRPVLRQVMGWTVRRLERRHPGIASRLAPIAGCRFLIIPVEFPFGILLQVSPKGHLILSLEDNPKTEADVCIRGTLPVLLRMLEGKDDGDALFFSRQLDISGNTEALLTLRNALDSESVGLQEVLPAALLPLLRAFVTGAETVRQACEADMKYFASALTDRLEKRCAGLDNRQKQQQREIDDLRSKVERLKKGKRT